MSEIISLTNLRIITLSEADSYLLTYDLQLRTYSTASSPTSALPTFSHSPTALYGSKQQVSYNNKAASH